MPNTKPQLDISVVKQKYLQGKSMNQIANESRISKGKVFYLINDWKKEIVASDFDEVRKFVTLCTKSNMSVEQCAQGFRMTNILKNLGIQECEDDTVYINEDDKHDTVNNQYNELSTFIQDIYLTCKNLGVAPSHIFSWMKDLVDFHSKSNSNIDNLPSMLENDDVFDKNPITHPIIQDSFPSDNKVESVSNIDDNYNTNPNAILKLKDDLQGQIKIPFTSQVSFYISQKKQEYGKLESYHKTLKGDLKKLEIQKNTVIDNLDQIHQKEKFVISYINWFYNLEKELLDNYSIKIKDDIQWFSQIIYDFKEQGYDAHQIIQEYSVIITKTRYKNI